MLEKLKGFVSSSDVKAVVGITAKGVVKGTKIYLATLGGVVATMFIVGHIAHRLDPKRTDQEWVETTRRMHAKAEADAAKHA